MRTCRGQPELQLAALMLLISAVVCEHTSFFCNQHQIICQHNRLERSTELLDESARLRAANTTGPLCSTAQRSTAQPCPAWDREVQHNNSTAQHRTTRQDMAQHSTAQHSTLCGLHWHTCNIRSASSYARSVTSDKSSLLVFSHFFSLVFVPMTT